MMVGLQKSSKKNFEFQHQLRLHAGNWLLYSLLMVALSYSLMNPLPSLVYGATQIQTLPPATQEIPYHLPEIDTLPVSGVQDQALVQPSARATAPLLVTQEIRYYLPEAGEVFLVWGINGWQMVPEEIRPAETEIKDKVMHTLMFLKSGFFVARLQAPAGATLEYSFLITRKRSGAEIKPIWDRSKNYQIKVTETRAAGELFRTQELHYHSAEAEGVLLVWGINGWQVIPEEIRPTGTTIDDNIMSTPLVRENDSFVVKVQIPVGAFLDYGFWITKKGSGADNEGIWDGSENYQTRVTADGVIVVTKLTLPQHQDRETAEAQTPTVVTQIDRAERIVTEAWIYVLLLVGICIVSGLIVLHKMIKPKNLL